MRELSFSFEVESNLTLFDDRVSALFDDNEKEKIIAKKDMLFKGVAGEVNKTEELDAAYTLVDNWLDFDRTIVEVFLSIKELGKLGLVQLSHLGYIALVDKQAIEVNLVSEGGEFQGTIAHGNTLEGQGLMVIRIFMPSPTRIVVMLGEKELFLDVPEGATKGIKIHGFLGHIAGTDARVHTIRTYDISSLDDLISSPVKLVSTEESIKGEIVATKEEKEEIKLVSSGKLKMAWTKETQEVLSSIQEGSPQDLALRKATSEAVGTWLQDQATNMEETTIQIISRLTGFQEAVILNMPRNQLLKQVYNGLLADKDYDSFSHANLLKETHYLCSQLLQDEDITIPNVGLGGKLYRTFEFGEVNDSNCTADKLLYLVKTYPDVWLKRLV